MADTLSPSLLLPDPERAQKNIESFIETNPEYAGRIRSVLPMVSTLFSYSQFLANHCIRKPEALFACLNSLHTSFETERLMEDLDGLFSRCGSIDEGMGVVRDFRKERLLIITLKDLLNQAEPQEVMRAMSNLADAVLACSLAFVEGFLSLRYGKPAGNSMVVMALGKLGARELNYSSDVDIIYVYRDEGETAGVPTPLGLFVNRISAFEYYCKLAEEHSKFLSRITGDSFAYRVDLRLRPQGTRGSLALSLRGYEDYYESWGQLWERAALLRTRPVAGDMELGMEFLELIRPFVYRKYLAFDAIEEIRRMKSQVEHIKPGTLSKDIKRGFGGIREIEFFIQIFQLIYAGKLPGLRERSTVKALHRLVQKGLIGFDDMRHLSENYIYLRTLEHRIQQLNDIQTHSLPSGDHELEILGRKMGYPGRPEFLADLARRRNKVREIYDSLLESGRKGEKEESGGLLSRNFWELDVPREQLLEEELSQKGVRDLSRAIHYLTRIRNTIYSFQTLRGRRLLEEILPVFVDEALKGPDPDTALRCLVDFSLVLAAKEAYLEAISQRTELVSAITYIFSQSDYLSRILMGNPECLESLVEGEAMTKSLSVLTAELGHAAERYGGLSAIRLLKRLEEIRLGILFLDRKITVAELMGSLSRVAEAVLSTLLRPTGLAVAGLGKLGGREITFNSDLDIIFFTHHDPEGVDVKAAEGIIKTLMSYTREGMAYTVDTRLRPDGNKGPLVASLAGLRDYYFQAAQPWELQALLKARPITGR
ncbi:MAG: hypothetical protein WC291_04570, partial [Thermodesulfovibrionales bacterium]